MFKNHPHKLQKRNVHGHTYGGTHAHLSFWTCVGYVLPNPWPLSLNLISQIWPGPNPKCNSYLSPKPNPWTINGVFLFHDPGHTSSTCPHKHSKMSKYVHTHKHIQYTDTHTHILPSAASTYSSCLWDFSQSQEVSMYKLPLTFPRLIYSYVCFFSVKLALVDLSSGREGDPWRAAVLYHTKTPSSY